MKKLIAIAVLLATASTFGAITGTIDAQYKGYSGSGVSVYLNGVSRGTVGTGIYQFQLFGQNINGGALHIPTYTYNNEVRFDAFCVDLAQNVYTGQHLYDAVDPGLVPNHTVQGMGAERAARLAELWGRVIGDNAVASVLNNNTKRAAFQLAVWEIVYESDVDYSSYDVTSGNGVFYSSLVAGNATANQANAWLNVIDGSGPSVVLAGMRHTGSPATHQDFIVRVVPAPAAALLGVLGLGAVAWVRRKLS